MLWFCRKGVAKDVLQQHGSAYRWVGQHEPDTRQVTDLVPVDEEPTLALRPSAKVTGQDPPNTVERTVSGPHYSLHEDLIVTVREMGRPSQVT